MNSQTQGIKTRIRMGWLLLAAGVVVGAIGVFVEIEFAYLSYNFRIITGLGILLAGIGGGTLVRNIAALKGDPTARRLSVEERDERTVLIRARAGNKAYWVSAALIYTGLMWESFAANGWLPALSGNVLWFFLAAGVLIPFGVYISSMLIDQRNL